jgi:hypothetical protein
VTPGTFLVGLGWCAAKAGSTDEPRKALMRHKDSAAF